MHVTNFYYTGFMTRTGVLARVFETQVSVENLIFLLHGEMHLLPLELRPYHGSYGCKQCTLLESHIAPFRACSSSNQNNQHFFHSTLPREIGRTR